MITFRNGPHGPDIRHPRSGVVAFAVAGSLAACFGVAALSAQPAMARPSAAAASSTAECIRQPRGRVLSSTPLLRLSSGQVAAELGGIGLPGTARYGIQSYRLVYCTVSTSGTATTASGLLVLPQDRRGTLPLVAYEHSTATARTDAPSFLREIEGRDVPFFFASDGFAVAAPDYLGLGTSPGGHPFLQATSEASASLDMLRAAESVSAGHGVRLSHRVFVSGFSQGGHAAMATARALRPLNGPWRLAAAAPMAGPYDLSGAESAAILDPNRTDSQHASVYLAYIFTAWKNLYHLYSDPRQVFTARYAGAIEGLFDGSHGFNEVDAALPAPQDLFRPETLALIGHPTGRYAKALRDNDVCRWAPPAPIRLYVGDGDRDAVPANAEQCRRQIVARGGTARIVDVGAVDHVGTAITSVPLVRTWFSRLATG